MITYTYIVKCPECDDEFFDFFDEAKDFAMGCLTKKPIITQTEVNRNDFGECTDHCDLGTVWSWEDMMKDTEPDDMVFSKDETFGISEGLDDFDDFDIGPQIDEFDNFDFEDVSTETLWVAENLIGGEIVAACWTDSEDLAHRLLSQAFRERTGGDLRDCYIREAEADEPDYIADNPGLLAEALTEDFDRVRAAAQCSRNCYDFYNAIAAKVSDKEIKPYAKAAAKFVKDNYGLTGKAAEDLLWSGYVVWKQLHESCKKDRKPIPEGMTIEQLKEEMEENEDTVECAGCEELFLKDECVHKEGIGYLCDDCADNVVQCTWCEELYDKSECRYEVDLGWLCSRCEAGIKSRGETLTFREGNYWDFLDEGATYFAGRDEDTFDPSKYCEFTYTFDHDEYGELEAVFHESYADILEALKEIVDDDYVRELSDEDEPQTEAEWKAAGKWDEFFTVDITAHISNLIDELVEYFEEDREEAVKEAVKEAEENDDGADPDGFYGWDDYYKWKNGDYTRW